MWHSGKEPTCQCKRFKRYRFDPWVGKFSWKRKWQPASVFLPGESHGQRSLTGYSPWGSQRVGHDFVYAQRVHTRTHTHTRQKTASETRYLPGKTLEGCGIYTDFGGLGLTWQLSW